MLNVLSLILTLIPADWTNALKYGAPCQTMERMTPMEYAHGAPNAEAPGFEILILKPYTERRVRCYNVGGRYLVRIKPNNVAETFAGFLLQSRLADLPNVRVGQFIDEGLDKVKWQYQPACQHRSDGNTSGHSAVEQASITHVSSTPKSKVDTLWTVEDNVGPVFFKGTVVKSQYVWWNDIRSDTIDYCKKSKPNERIEMSDTDQKISKPFQETCNDIVPSCKTWSHFCETHAFIFRYCPMTCMKCVSFR